jgi:hypothetical protein
MTTPLGCDTCGSWTGCHCRPGENTAATPFPVEPRYSREFDYSHLWQAAISRGTSGGPYSREHSGEGAEA